MILAMAMNTQEFSLNVSVVKIHLPCPGLTEGLAMPESSQNRFSEGLDLP